MKGTIVQNIDTELTTNQRNNDIKKAPTNQQSVTNNLKDVFNTTATEALNNDYYTELKELVGILETMSKLTQRLERMEMRLYRSTQ